MTTVKTTGEYYRVALRNANSWDEPDYEGPFQFIPDAVEKAMRLTVDLKVSCAVERVTTHEPHEDPSGSGEITTETVTGRVFIPGPRSYNDDPQLTRHDDTLGWLIPLTIDPNEEGAGELI